MDEAEIEAEAIKLFEAEGEGYKSDPEVAGVISLLNSLTGNDVTVGDVASQRWEDVTSRTKEMYRQAVREGERA